MPSSRTSSIECRRSAYVLWVPACAGMTDFRLWEQFYVRGGRLSMDHGGGAEPCAGMTCLG
jgi:hypothetical protein